MKLAKAPAGLSPAAKKWWMRIQREYADWTPDALLTLENTLRAFDRLEQARAEVDQYGITVLDRFGQRRTNPAVQIERDSRAAVLAGLKALGLDDEELPQRSASELGRAAAMSRWNRGRS